MIVFKWNPMTGLMDMIDKFVGGVLTKLLTLSKEGIQLNTTDDITGTPPEGRVWWNKDDHTLNVQSDIVGTVNQVGQENWLRARNDEAVTINEGEVVYIFGANTARPTVKLAIASNGATADKVIGVATVNITAGALGVITTFGLVRHINTNVDSSGVSLSDGDPLYLSATQAGKWVKAKPHAPNHTVVIGQVVNAASGGAGNLFVSTSTGTHLQDLHDVNVETSLADKDILLYNGVSGIWENKTKVAGLGDTFVQKAGDTMTGDLTLDTANIIVPGQTGYGIKMDTGTATYGWQDMLGTINARTSGTGTPAYNIYRGGIRAYQFAVNDEVWVEFHMLHDYAPGTDLYLHAHWSHTSAAVTAGGVTWGFEVIYAKGHNQAAFSAPITATIQQNASTAQYQHMIAELQLTSSTPTANQIDTALIETDGVLLVRVYLVGNTMSAATSPFLHVSDMHYQTKTVGTKNKAPNFYVT